MDQLTTTPRAADTAVEALTVSDLLPWTQLTLDYSDALCAQIPDNLLNWRPIDPSGGFCFSLAQLAMHISDSRLRFARQLSGKPSTEGYWSAAEASLEDGSWDYPRVEAKAELLERLASARRELEHWLDLPAEQLHDTTPHSIAAHQERLERGTDEQSEALRRRGPATIMRVLMAATVHEAGHRGALQTLLRQLGVNLPR